MSQSQIIAVVAALVILIAILVWARRSGSDFTAATAGTFAATDASTAAAAITVLQAADVNLSPGDDIRRYRPPE